jgi:hypothetical protein
MLLISSASFGQDLFKVLASKGTNKVISNGTETALLIGRKLIKGDKLTVSEGGYVGLAHVSGKTIEIKKAGTYTADALVAEVSTQNSAAAQKYVNFVAGQMTSNSENLAQNKHQYMGVTGSVERAIGASINVLSHKKEEVYNDAILIRWSAVDSTPTYVVIFENMFDEQVYKVETSNTEIVVDMSKLNIKTQEDMTLKYRIEVKGRKIKSADNSITYVAASKEQKVASELTAIKKENPEDNALNRMVLAAFYEDNGLILNAMEQYQEAMKLEPEVEDYRLAYAQFLERTGLVVIKK